MAQSKYGYIPPSVQRSMDQHMQRMPANLQKYQSGKTYIPAKAAQEMTSYMKKSMPAHMQEYITPYMHQQTQAGLSSLDPVSSRSMQPKAPAPNLMRRDHSSPGQQFSVKVNGSNSTGSLSFSPQYSDQTGPPSPAPPPAPMPQGNQNPYDFIVNSGQKPKRPLSFGGGSKQQRLLIVAAGFGVLLVLALVIISVFSGSGGNTEELVKLIQKQNEIARVAAIGREKATGSMTKNLAATVQLGISSDQASTVGVLGKAGKKIDKKELALSQNKQTDDRLDAASSAGTFDSTFNKIIKDELTEYLASLQGVYKTSSKVETKQVLQNSFDSVHYILGTNQKT